MYYNSNFLYNVMYFSVYTENTLKDAILQLCTNCTHIMQKQNLYPFEIYICVLEDFHKFSYTCVKTKR